MTKREFETAIDDFVLGRLSPADRQRFEAAMAADPALQDAVWQRRITWESEELLAEKALRAQIRQAFLENETGNSTPKNTKKWWPLLLVAAALAITGWLLFDAQTSKPVPSKQPDTAPSPTGQPHPVAPPPSQAPADSVPASLPPRPVAQQDNKSNYQVLALSAYQLPEQLTGTRGDTASDDTVSLAAAAFSQKNYRQVVRLLAVLPQSSKQEALSLRAHARFLMGNYAAAKTDFALLLDGGVYQRDAEWYGLLAALSQPSPNLKAALKQLDGIRKDVNHPYKDAAQALWIKVSALEN